jgi:enhancing lycopene biosynthesis protein 2
MKVPKIILKNYDKLLLEVKNHVEKTAETISKIATRKKVEMAWNLGKSIQNYLEENKQSDKSIYGKHLFEQLAKDIKISQAVLYRMRSFYKSYPELPKDDDKLNWSHYRILAGIKDEDERKYLEDLTREQNLDAEKLRKKSQKIKQQNASQEQDSTSNSVAVKKLKFTRGKLFCYKLIDVAELDSLCVDCGFGIFHQLNQDTPAGVAVIETIKSKNNFVAKKSNAKAANLNAYKAYLRKVVDGDTIHVVLDLGFKIFHEEILRLRQINAPEINTAAGEIAKEALQKILQDLPFLIVKTHATDIYGRYLADVFLPDVEQKFSAAQTVENGEYLSQILLDQKLVELF